MSNPRTTKTTRVWPTNYQPNLQELHTGPHEILPRSNSFWLGNYIWIQPENSESQYCDVRTNLLGKY